MGEISVPQFPPQQQLNFIVSENCSGDKGEASMVVQNPPAMQETWIQSLGQEDPLGKRMATHSSILSWKFYGQGSLVGCSPWGYKELDPTEQLIHTIPNSCSFE